MCCGRSAWPRQGETVWSASPPFEGKYAHRFDMQITHRVFTNVIFRRGRLASRGELNVKVYASLLAVCACVCVGVGRRVCRGVGVGGRC